MKQKIIGALSVVMFVTAAYAVDAKALFDAKQGEAECPGGYSPGACIIVPSCEWGFIYSTCKPDGTWSQCWFECLPVTGEPEPE